MPAPNVTIFLMFVIVCVAALSLKCVDSVQIEVELLHTHYGYVLQFSVPRHRVVYSVQCTTHLYLTILGSGYHSNMISSDRGSLAC